MPKAHKLNMETVFVNGHPKPLDKTRLANVVFENMHKAGGYQAGIETAYVEGHPKPLVKTRLANFVFENLHEAGGAGRWGVYEGGGVGRHDQDQDTSSTNVKDTVERGGCRCTKATVSETVTIETVTITLPPQ